MGGGVAGWHAGCGWRVLEGLSAGCVSMDCLRAVLSLAILCLAGPVAAQTEAQSAARAAAGYAVLPAELRLVPQTMLGLVHAAEVQREIGLGVRKTLDFAINCGKSMARGGVPESCPSLSGG